MFQPRSYLRLKRLTDSYPNREMVATSQALSQDEGGLVNASELLMRLNHGSSLGILTTLGSHICGTAQPSVFPSNRGMVRMAHENPACNIYLA